MAKVKTTEALADGSHVLLGDYYTDEELLLSEGSTAKKGIYHDGEQQSDIIFKGDGIKYAENAMTKGTIDEIVFRNGDTQTLFTVKGFEQKAADLYALLNSPNGVEDVLAKILGGDDIIDGSDSGDWLFFDKGNDRIDGGKGDDIIAGGRGKDILIGGKGSDYFYIEDNYGTDTIADFHAGGGAGVQDQLLGHLDMVTLKKQGDDLLVTYNEMEVSFLLEGIKKSQIDESDFGGFIAF
jgi:hypothetical protein